MADGKQMEAVGTNELHHGGLDAYAGITAERLFLTHKGWLATTDMKGSGNI